MYRGLRLFFVLLTAKTRRFAAMTPNETRLIEALTSSNTCLAEAAFKLDRLGEHPLRDDLREQIGKNVLVIREISQA
jgi:hypothetical protein